MKNIIKKAERLASISCNSISEYRRWKTAFAIALTIDHIIFIPLFGLYDKIFGKK